MAKINAYEDRACLLTGYGEDSQHVVAVVIVPQAEDREKVQAAWSYALRYGADGVDLPNYGRAVALLMQRHPHWIAVLTRGFKVEYKQAYAENDMAED